MHIYVCTDVLILFANRSNIPKKNVLLRLFFSYHKWKEESRREGAKEKERKRKSKYQQMTMNFIFFKWSCDWEWFIFFRAKFECIFYPSRLLFPPLSISHCRNSVFLWHQVPEKIVACEEIMYWLLTVIRWHIST